MWFKIDENLPDDVAISLRQEAHDVETVRSQGHRGCDDTFLAACCNDERRALVTLDLDIADIRAFPPAMHSGLIVLRASNQSRSHVVRVPQRALEMLQSQPLTGRLWVVTDAGVRIREA